MKEISEECGKSRSHTNHLLNELKAKGLVDTQTFVIQKGEHLRAIQYYKLKKTGKI
jgi:predicted transcriptional regulator